MSDRKPLRPITGAESYIIDLLIHRIDPAMTTERDYTGICDVCGANVIPDSDETHTDDCALAEVIVERGKVERAAANAERDQADREDAAQAEYERMQKSLSNVRLSDLDCVKADPINADGWYVWMITDDGRKLLGRTECLRWKRGDDGKIFDLRVFVRHFNGELWPGGPFPVDQLFVI